MPLLPHLPGHALPNYSEEDRDDALFHYTTASGLIGILTSRQIWSTAYYCANDESELETGRGVLTPLFREATAHLIAKQDHRVSIFARRGVDIMHYADNFEQFIEGAALSTLGAYITCFFRPVSQEDFHHGLLSQWRGYGSDGGYAIQFSRKKLNAAIERAALSDLNYDLQDIHYEPENPLKEEVLQHSDAFVASYMAYLDELAEPIDFNKKTMRSPIQNLPGGPLESLLTYLVHTKNKHFSEERECRLTLTQLISNKEIGGHLPVHYFNRNGLVVPYTQTPTSNFNVIDCIEWILIGPGPRVSARFKSIVEVVRQLGLDAHVRPSHIPFTRL